MALALLEGFSLPDVCWKYNTAEREQFRRLLECVEEKFPTQLVRESAREGSSWTCVCNRVGLGGELMLRGCLGHSAPKMVALVSWRSKKGGQQNCHLPKADFDQFRRLVEKIPWDPVLYR